MHYTVAWLLAWASLVPLQHEGGTVLRLIVVDVRSIMVAQVRLTLDDADGQRHLVTTDAGGQALVAPLPGTIVFIRHAQHAGGQVLQVEPTTASQGLRLGLIPGHERTVRLIVDGGVLFLDPEVIFGGADPTVQHLPAPATPRAPSASTPPASTSDRPVGGTPAVAGAENQAPPTIGASSAPSAEAQQALLASSTAVMRGPTSADRSPDAPVPNRTPMRMLVYALLGVLLSTIVVLIGSFMGWRRHT